MVVLERVDGSAKAGVDHHFEQGQGGTHRVRVEGKRRSGSQKAIENIVGIGSETNEEEKLWSLFYRTNNTVDLGT